MYTKNQRYVLCLLNWLHRWRIFILGLKTGMREWFPFETCTKDQRILRDLNMSVIYTSSRYLCRVIKLRSICFQVAVESLEKIKSLESYSVCGKKEQLRIQPSRQPRRGDKPESGAKANWSSTSAGRTKRHLFFIYWVLFSGSCVKLKIQSIVIAQNLSCILSMPVYKKRIISYFSNPEKGKKKPKTKPHMCFSN